MTLSFRMNLDELEQKKVEDLKKFYGVKANTELIRLLINDAWKASVCVETSKELEK